MAHDKENVIVPSPEISIFYIKSEKYIFAACT